MAAPTTARSSSVQSSTRTAANGARPAQMSDGQLSEKNDGKEAVVDPQSGKVELKDKGQGPYTTPRW